MEEATIKLENSSSSSSSSSNGGEVQNEVQIQPGIGSVAPGTTVQQSGQDGGLDGDIPAQNPVAAEPKKQKKKEKSIYKGVFRCGNKFKAQIQTNGVQHYLGLFDDEKEAARAYDAHARMVLGPRAKTNLEYKDDEGPEVQFAAIIPTTKPAAATTNPTTGGVAVGVSSSSSSSGTVELTAGLASAIAAGLTVHPPEKTGGVTKRVYVGIKARQNSGKRPASTMGASSDVARTKSLAESVAGAIQDSSNSQLAKRPRITPNGGSFGQNGIEGMAEYDGSSSSGSGGIIMNGFSLQSASRDDWEQHGGVGGGMNSHYFDNGIGIMSAFDEDDNGMLEDEEYEPDWRDQIYYWTGLLSVDDDNSCLVWKGSWLGSFTGKPNPEEFAWSTNEFEYMGERVTNSDDLYAQGLLRPKSGYFKGFYLMDNDGSGNLEKYLDNEYYIEFEEVRGLHPPRYTVIGKGESDFGTFVLTGTYNAGNRVLEMARQYISEDDERCSMDISQLKQHLIAAAAGIVS